MPAGSIDRRRARAVGVGTLTIVALLVPLGWALLGGAGTPQQRLELSGGGAWLATPGKGFVTLIDGPSDQVVATVITASTGSELSVTQDGASAFVADDTTGTVSRIDGATYQTSAPVRFGAPRSELAVLAGGGSAFVVDATSRVATVVDPDNLAIVRTFTLAARPGPLQSMVGASGRLWAVDADGSGLNWFDRGGGHGRADADRTAQLVTVAGRPALVGVGTAQPRISWLDSDGGARPWSCHLPSRSGDTVRLLGSTTGNEIFAAVSQTGTLVVADDGDQRCGAVVEIGDPGAVFGDLVQSGRFVLVPNRTTGAAVIVDTRTETVAATVPLTAPGHQLQLVTKDGLVFYNDLDSEKAGVLLQNAAGSWVAGKAIQKYNPGTGSPSNPVVSSSNAVSPGDGVSSTDAVSSSHTTKPDTPTPAAATASRSTPTPTPTSSGSPLQPVPPPVTSLASSTGPPVTSLPESREVSPLPTPAITTSSVRTLTSGRTVATPPRTVPRRTTPPATTVPPPTSPTRATGPPRSSPPRTPVPPRLTTSPTPPTSTTPTTPVPIIVDIAASGALSTGSSASFSATVDNPSGAWSWNAVSDTGHSLSTGSAAHSFSFPIPTSGVASVTVSLTVGVSAPKTRTFPVAVAPVVTSIDASGIPANIWDDFTIDPAVSVISSSGAPTATGSISLHVNDPHGSPVDIDADPATLTSSATAAWDSIQPAGAGKVTLTFHYSGDLTHQAANLVVRVGVSTEAMVADSGCRRGDPTLGENPSDAYLYARITPDSGGHNLSATISGSGFHGGAMTYRRAGSAADESEFDFRVDPGDYSTTTDYDVNMTEIATGLQASSGTTLVNDIAHGDCLL